MLQKLWRMPTKRSWLLSLSTRARIGKLCRHGSEAPVAWTVQHLWLRHGRTVLPTGKVYCTSTKWIHRLWRPVNNFDFMRVQKVMTNHQLREVAEHYFWANDRCTYCALCYSKDNRVTSKLKHVEQLSNSRLHEHGWLLISSFQTMT